MKKSLYIALGLAAITGLTACQADMDTPALDIPEATLTPNMTILQLKNTYENKTEQLKYLPGTEVLDEEGNEIDGEHIVIHGRIVSSDASGNIYKSIVIQDETAALAFSINQGSLYNSYRLGQEVVVDMTGLWIGYYRNLQQIGYPNEEYNGQPQLGFMAYDYWLNNASLNGLPDPKFENVKINSGYPSDEYYCITFDNFDELNNGTLPELQSQLVEFRDVSFKIAAGEETYAPYQESVNRTLVDSNGKTLTVRNSGYSNFYNHKLPEGRGNVRGILSYYSDAWQLVLRDLSDVMITSKGEENDPFSVNDVLGEEYNGMSGWTKGYIVGSVKAGVTTVTAESDVIFGTSAEMDNNILIASDPNETDFTQCIVVELPQNTMLRYYTNLLDNPDVYKKELLVNGKLGSFLGLPGVVNSTGGKNDFKIDGSTISEGGELPPVAGSGTKDDPYNISYVIDSTNDQDDVWVTGYVAGYVSTGDFSAETAEFSANETAGSTNWLNSTNIILSALAPMKCGVGNSVPAQLNASCRPTLGLRVNPTVFGKRVKVKCRIATYLGTRGIRNISEVELY